MWGAPWRRDPKRSVANVALVLVLAALFWPQPWALIVIAPLGVWAAWPGLLRVWYLAVSPRGGTSPRTGEQRDL